MKQTALPDIAVKLKGKSPMIAKTVEPDSMTAHNILDMTKKLPPSDLKWLVRQLGNLSDKQDSENLNAPSPELIAQPDTAADSRDGRAYRRLMDETDWHSAPADVLDRAIGLALSFGDMKRGKALTELGLRRFPDHKQIARTWLLFNPRPARVIKTAWHPPRNWFRDSMEWIKQHVNEYEIGHWLAVRPGELVADAPTRDELDKKLSVLPEDKKPCLIYSVIP
jgi:hypothetical protein